MKINSESSRHEGWICKKKQREKVKNKKIKKTGYV
jgi:hypothetical protein